MELKKLTLTDFKGVRSANYDFYHKTLVSGQNGSGKSTIADAFCFCFCNENYAGVSNPQIFPNDGRECVPTVRFEFEQNGVNISVEKSQKRTISKPDANGVTAQSYTNYFKVNEVEVSKTNFEKKLEGYGIRLDIFAELTHPDLFLRGIGQKKDNDRIRAVLMPMASDHSDLEIATANNLTEVAKLLESYSVEEITAMQNSSLRKIREEYGKDGEILRAKIEGMELSKVDIDVAELELEKNRLTEELKTTKEKQDDLSKQLEESEQIKFQIEQAEQKIRHIQSHANEQNRQKRLMLNDSINDGLAVIANNDRKISNLGCDVKDNDRRIERLNSALERCREEYRFYANQEFDDNKYVCPTCGQEYPAEKKEELRKSFESDKEKAFAECKTHGEEVKKLIAEEQKLKQEHEEEIARLQERNKKVSEEIDQFKNELSELPEEVSVNDNSDVIALRKEIAELQEKYIEPTDYSGMKVALYDEYVSTNLKLTEVEKQIALFSRNTEIDETIAGLRSKQIEYEQNKANCEKILYQLDLLARAKNELVADDINSHFKLVDFKLFQFQKNGEYKSCCIPMIDGYELGTCTNKGREVLAKLDIIRGLQDFYGVNYPVILDDFERLSDTSISRINTERQLIMLKVSNYKKIAIMDVDMMDDDLKLDNGLPRNPTVFEILAEQDLYVDSLGHADGMIEPGTIDEIGRTL